MPMVVEHIREDRYCLGETDERSAIGRPFSKRGRGRLGISVCLFEPIVTGPDGALWFTEAPQFGGGGFSYVGRVGVGPELNPGPAISAIDNGANENTVPSLKEFPRLSHVPIAILTSSQASIDKHRTARQNVRFIQKPSQLADFLSTVGRAAKEMLA